MSDLHPEAVSFFLLQDKSLYYTEVVFGVKDLTCP